jgi:SOS response regulatory protein OraA/RecX
VLFVDKREGDEDMTKQSIASLTRKGYSQKKIAKTLGIRKMKVVTYQKAHKIGKRVTQPFWRDVKSTMELKEVSRVKAIKEVKFAPKWFKKRQARLKGAAKARDEMREKWYRIKRGEIERTIFDEPEIRELLDFAGYD